MDAMVSAYFSTTIKIFALMTPPAVLSAFLSGTRCLDTAQKHKTALRTGIAVFIIGSVLYFFGENLFNFFGFTLDAFRIGSGALLFLSAISVMNGPDDDTHCGGEQDISVVPLAIPLCMGPASIGTVMVLGASATSMTQRIIGALALLTASFGIYIMLYAADKVEKVLRKTGIAILAKLTGLLLAAIAAQVVFTGIRSFLK